MQLKELAREIRRRAYLKGDFTLRSGATSNEYFDKYQFESNPKLLRAVADAMVRLIPPDIDVLAGIELGGVPLATMLSQLTGLPTLFVRKQAKTYGTRQLAEGGDIEGRCIVVVDDVATTAGQIVESANQLRSQGGIVNYAIVVIDRKQGGESKLAGSGIELRSLFSSDEINQA